MQHTRVLVSEGRRDISHIRNCIIFKPFLCFHSDLTAAVRGRTWKAEDRPRGHTHLQDGQRLPRKCLQVVAGWWDNSVTPAIQKLFVGNERKWKSSCALFRRSTQPPHHRESPVQRRDPTYHQVAGAHGQQNRALRLRPHPTHADLPEGGRRGEWKLLCVWSFLRPTEGNSAAQLPNKKNAQRCISEQTGINEEKDNNLGSTRNCVYFISTPTVSWISKEHWQLQIVHPYSNCMSFWLGIKRLFFHTFWAILPQIV